MSYNSKHVEIMDPKTWYDLIADQYWKYHSHLDSFCDLEIQRYLPRDTDWIDIIDLWAGDGRVLKYFEWINYRKYVACDISEKLLKKHPTNWLKIEKVVCDLESKLPFEDDSFDVATSFFVIEHIEDLKWLFWEVYRILKEEWRRIIWYFLQRKEFEWEAWKWKEHKKFKIQQYRYRLEEIQEAAEYNFFKFNYQEVVENWILIGYIIVCEK